MIFVIPISYGRLTQISFQIRDWLNSITTLDDYTPSLILEFRIARVLNRLIGVAPNILILIHTLIVSHVNEISGTSHENGFIIDVNKGEIISEFIKLNNFFYFRVYGMLLFNIV